MQLALDTLTEEEIKRVSECFCNLASSLDGINHREGMVALDMVMIDFVSQLEDLGLEEVKEILEMHICNVLNGVQENWCNGGIQSQLH